MWQVNLSKPLHQLQDSSNMENELTVQLSCTIFPERLFTFGGGSLSFHLHPPNSFDIFFVEGSRDILCA